MTDLPATETVRGPEVVGGAALGTEPLAARRDATGSLGAVEAVLDPARLFAAPKRAPFEPGKARYTPGAWMIDWATLLKRVNDLDALACPCGGRLKFVEVVTKAARARQLLEQFGLGHESPTIARARSPTFDFDFDPPAPDDWQRRAETTDRSRRPTGLPRPRRAEVRWIRSLYDCTSRHLAGDPSASHDGRHGPFSSAGARRHWFA